MNIISLIFLLIHQFYLIDVRPEPKVKDYYSIDSSYYARIFPEFIPEKYWKWEKASTKNKKKFSPVDTIIVHCHAKMFKRTLNGDSLIWKRNLINETAPTNAFLSEDGQYLTTFDEWFSPGYGNNVFVYYNKEGRLVKQFGLKDISPFPLEKYTRTISSIIWNCGAKFIDNDRVLICFKNKEMEKKEVIYNLKEGRIEKG